MGRLLKAVVTRLYRDRHPDTWCLTSCVGRSYPVLAAAISSVLLVFGIAWVFLFASASGDWRPTHAVPEPNGIASHAAFSTGDYLYVIGGRYGTATDPYQIVYQTIYSAQVQVDGSLEPWARDVFATPIAYAGVAISDSHVYLTGGRGKSEAEYSKIYCGQIDNGKVTGWTTIEGATSFGARFGHAAVLVRNRLYALGGTRDRQSIPSVVYSDVTAGCPSSAWLTTTSLNPSTGRTGHAAVAFKGYIYIIGGLSKIGNDWVPLNSVYYTNVDKTNGKLGDWLPTEGLSDVVEGLAYPSAFVAESQRRIYVIGGLDRRNKDWDQAFVSDAIYSSYINPEGTLAGWKPEPSLKLLTSLYHHRAILNDDGGVYIIGGQQTSLDAYTSSVYYIPPLTLTKSNDPPGPVHEGDVITYTISYTNTSLVTQIITITDLLPFNVTLVPGSISWPGERQDSTLVWELDGVPPGGSGAVSFKVHVPLLPSAHPEPVAALGSPGPSPPPARVLPALIACDTTRFWAVGVTRQPPEPKPHTIQVQIPPGAAPSQMWLAVKEASDIGLTVDGIQATRIATSNNQIGASLWSAPITTEAVDSGMVTVVTGSPRRLNALFLFDEDDPPFDETILYDVYNNAATVPETFTYTLEIPTVETQTMDVLLPFMDISYWRDDLQPDTRVTTVTVEFNDQSHTVAVSDPNLGNGLLMTEFPFDIGPYTDAITKTRVLTITVDTEDSIYTLGPRVCRPVYIENTAWLCSDQAGCISATAENIPEGFAPPSVYLPIILKPYP
jgi:uncharacterized repeat protein (TIGR01451 family)